jgi:multiple sugar transport system substrate-binding protein
MIKSFAKPLSLISLLLLAMSILAGCGVLGIGGGSSSGQVTVTWLVRTDPVMNPWEKQTVKDFEAAHPNIQVQLIIVPNPQYDQKLLTMQAAGTPADVFTHWGQNSWADFVYRGLAADMTPYVNASHFSFEGMDPKLQQLYTVKGKIYGIPFATGGSFLFYNVDLFKQAHLPMPPTNWDDPSWTWNTVLKDAQAISKTNGPISQRVYGFSDDLWPENANAWLFGGDIFEPSTYTNGVVNTVTANSPQVQQATQWKHDLIYKYKVAPTPADATLLNGFLSGKVGMSVTGVWGLWNFQPAKFHWAAAPLPRIQTNKDVIFTDPWMMAKTSKHPQETWTFIQYLSDPTKGAKSYMEASGAVPPWSQLMPDWAKSTQKFIPSLTTDQLTQLATGSISHGQESINHLAIGYGQYESVISNVMSPVYTNKETPQAALSQLQSQLEATIQKNGAVSPLS